MKAVKAFLFLFIIAVSFQLNAQEKMNILVEPFKNNGSKDFSWISSGMTETCIADLAKFKEIRVISENERRKALEEITLAQSGVVGADDTVQVGNFLGAHVIFSGSYTVVGEKVRVLVRLTNVKTGETEKSVKLDGDLQNIFDLQDKIVVSLLKETEKLDISGVNKLKVTDTVVKKIESNPKYDLTAYEYYCRGLDTMDSSPRTALDYFLKAIQLQKDYAEAYKLAGYVYSGILYDTDNGYKYLKQSDQLYQSRKETDTSNYADLLTLIGGNYYNRYIYDEALKYYFRSMKLYESLGERNSHGYANVNYGIGAALEGQKKHDEAITYYNKADALFKNLKMTGSTSYGHLMYGIAYVHGQLAEYPKALEYYLKAKDIYERNRMGSNPIYGHLLYNIAWVYDMMKKYSDAVFYYDEAYSCYERAGYEGSEKNSVKSRADELRPYIDQQ